MINYEAFFRVSYGLYIVSAGNDQKRNGFISNSVFQVTAEPPRFAASCNKDNYTAQLIQKQGFYSISVLKQEADIKLIGKFGYKTGNDIDKFEGISYITGETGVPVVLEDTLAYMECKIFQTVDVGTHLIFIGDVVLAELMHADATPLTYDHYRKIRKGVAPKNAPTYIDKNKILQKTETSLSAKYKCPACGYIYDPEKGDDTSGIPPGTSFEDLPDDWICPLCGTEKSDFVKF